MTSIHPSIHSSSSAIDCHFGLPVNSHNQARGSFGFIPPPELFLIQKSFSLLASASYPLAKGVSRVLFDSTFCSCFNQQSYFIGLLNLGPFKVVELFRETNLFLFDTEYVPGILVQILYIFVGEVLFQWQ